MNLEQTLLQRAQPQLSTGLPLSKQPSQIPGVMSGPPNPHTTVPPAVERYENGQTLQKAYANDWSPNPMLLRAMMSRQKGL